MVFGKVYGLRSECTKSAFLLDALVQILLCLEMFISKGFMRMNSKRKVSNWMTLTMKYVAMGGLTVRVKC